MSYGPWSSLEAREETWLAKPRITELKKMTLRSICWVAILSLGLLAKDTWVSERNSGSWYQWKPRRKETWVLPREGGHGFSFTGLSVSNSWRSIQTALLLFFRVNMLSAFGFPPLHLDHFAVICQQFTAALLLFYVSVWLSVVLIVFKFTQLFFGALLILSGLFLTLYVHL